MFSRREMFERWGLSALSLNIGFLQAKFEPNDTDRAAAWDLYVELLTRITTQTLSKEDGDEKTALDSVFSLFQLTRATLKQHGSGCNEFAKLAIPVLNQVIRPFTARWHKRSLEGAFDKSELCDEFRAELASLQVILRSYTKALAEMASVEDLTSLEADLD